MDATGVVYYLPGTPSLNGECDRRDANETPKGRVETLVRALLEPLGRRRRQELLRLGWSAERVDRATNPTSTSDAWVGGHERDPEHLGKSDIGGVVGSEVVPELPATRYER